MTILRTHELTSDPALSKAYDVPNSVITNGSDRWCRHFIERRRCSPNKDGRGGSPYAANTGDGPCVPSPSGDNNGFVLIPLSSTANIILVSLHVPFCNLELLFEWVVLDSHLAFERGQDECGMRILQTQKRDERRNGGVLVFWETSSKGGKLLMPRLAYGVGL